ncbi:hypothetical protein [Delftia tsuruhatensis]|uniref:hypothetical protein n=1 Tax=Delftia tsuruhatensis TaxID=180282 RepID=UPI00370A651F
MIDANHPKHTAHKRVVVSERHLKARGIDKYPKRFSLPLKKLYQFGHGMHNEERPGSQ